MFFSLFYRILLLIESISVQEHFPKNINSYPPMPQHPRKTTAKLVISYKSAKEKAKKHKLFLPFS